MDVYGMKYGIWSLRSSGGAERTERLEQAGFSPLAAAVLCGRGCDTPEAARELLGSDCPLSDPFALKDMEKAKERVLLAVERKEHICVFGDYDVDGITATCLLTEFLREKGANVTSYIPARLEEGYGLNSLAIDTLAQRGVQLIVTVDCGITACEEAARCRSLGIDLVITDHHECKDELPDAIAVVDPHRPDQEGAQRDLAGVGVAFKLAAAISGDQQELLEEYCDLVCLGTVADVMSLTGENRAIVSKGLAALANPKRVGLAALMAECGCVRPPVTAGIIGYTLAPRINAAGRMGQVDDAVELFLTGDASRAIELAQTLCRLNRKRQEVESGIYRSAVAKLPKNKMPSAIVLADDSWHQGVVGIVASRLAEEYCCPTFLICLDGDKGKASSRSYGGFNLFCALQEHSDLLESYGGHELAAGFTIRRDRIDQFRERICARAEEYYESEENASCLQIDCAVAPQLLTLANVESLDVLEPCGTGCPRPVLCLESMRVAELSEIGGGKHLRLRITRGGCSFYAIFFSATALRTGIAVGDSVDVAFTPQINEYRSQRSVQLNVIDVRPDRAQRQAEAEAEQIYRRFSERRGVSGEEAAALLPERSDFVAVWRYLQANAAEGVLCEEPACLSRKLARQTRKNFSCALLRVCLDVFREQQLLQLRPMHNYLHITLCADGKKADLTQSLILKRLRDMKGR